MVFNVVYHEFIAMYHSGFRSAVTGPDSLCTTVVSDLL